MCVCICEKKKVRYAFLQCQSVEKRKETRGKKETSRGQGEQPKDGNTTRDTQTYMALANNTFALSGHVLSIG